MSAKIEIGARLLETLTSALYADPLVVFREYVQNSVDAFRRLKKGGESTIDSCRIAITVDSVKRTILIEDNCGGIPKEQFEATMLGLSRSEKDGDQDSIGFRGIGRLAGLAFCKRLIFRNNTKGATQSFCLRGADYRKILQQNSSKAMMLDEVIERISDRRVDETSATLQGGVSFQVELDDIEDELFDRIFQRKQATETLQPAREFVNELALMLPVGYERDFSHANDLRTAFKEATGLDLADREYEIEFNGKLLCKPFLNESDKSFSIQRVHLTTKEGERRCVGILWLRFNYVMKACGRNFGVFVRNKNMLLRGGPVFAEEAAKSGLAVTTYGQYFAAIKGIQGELLLDTNLLSDNSRRDWFKTDNATLQLREYICNVMNRVHKYRYSISRYIHNNVKTEEEKNSVRLAYQRLVSGDEDKSLTVMLGSTLVGMGKDDGCREVDERADITDLHGYTKAQRDLYRYLMLAAYEYFMRQKDDGVTKYYAFKAHIVEQLNRQVEG